MSTASQLSFIGLTLAVPVLASCSDRQNSASVWDGSVRDSAGIEIVQNYGTPLWADADAWALSEVLRIGVGDGDPNYMFGRIEDVGVLSSGRIVIADGISQNLRFFHSDGRWEKTVGQAGSGPGEYGNVWLTILVGPGDTLLVTDVQNQRANRVAPDGTWLDSWPAYRPEDGWMEKAWDYSSTGRLVSQMYQIPELVGDESSSLDFVVIRDLAGSVGDTVGFMSASLGTQVSGGRTEYHIFAGEPASSLCPDNSLLTGRQDLYEIRRYDPVGALEQVVRLDREVIPVSESDRNTWRQWYKDFWMESGYYTPSRVEGLLSAFRFNETYPTFRTLNCGPNGSIWIQPWKPVSALIQEDFPDVFQGIPADAAGHFEVFDRRGRYLGKVSLPPGFFPIGFRDESLFGRWRDSLDVDYVKVLRINGIAGGAEG